VITIGRLATQFHLSRSTLLYYDRIGLLHPSGRSPANYRLYTDDDVERLRQICLYRDTGLELKTIARLLESPDSGASEALGAQLQALNERISKLRRQQHLIASLLNRSPSMPVTQVMDRESWTALMRASGMDDAGMMHWHQEFERIAPDAHQNFLESLGIPGEEARAIRDLVKPQEDSEAP
jgi:DNA-binding transcriptional MerR regulator